MNTREVTMKYGCLVVSISNDFAEIWGFRYGLTLVIGTLKIMASIGVFMLVICALRHSISGHGRQTRILTYITHEQSLSYQ
jgi:Na+/serine symporter